MDLGIKNKMFFFVEKIVLILFIFSLQINGVGTNVLSRIGLRVPRYYDDTKMKAILIQVKHIMGLTLDTSRR